MLIRSKLTLQTPNTVALPRSYGVELIKRLYGKMGLSFEDQRMPEITFSGLLGFCQTDGDFLIFSSDETYKVVLSGLDKIHADAIAQLDLSELNFLGASFSLCDRENQITSYEELYQQYIASEPEPLRQFDLQFLTPTAFAQDQLYLPLPVPILMFRSWLQRWNHFSSIYLGGDELLQYLSHAIPVYRHRIQTRSRQVYQSKISGFTGDVTLKVLHRADPLIAQVASLLVEYSTFAGTGIKTRLGMGCTFQNPTIEK